MLVETGDFAALVSAVRRDLETFDGFHALSVIRALFHHLHEHLHVSLCVHGARSLYHLLPWIFEALYDLHLVYQFFLSSVALSMPFENAVHFGVLEIPPYARHRASAHLFQSALECYSDVQCVLLPLW